MLLVVYKEGLKTVASLFTKYLKEKHPLKLEWDKIGLKLLTETNGVKSRYLVLEFVAIIALRTWKIFLLDILLFQWLTLLMIFWFFLGKRADNPENVDWTPSVFNYARAALKEKLVMKDQSVINNLL